MALMFRDYHMRFWLSPEVSTQDPIIRLESFSPDNVRGMMLSAMTKTPCYNMFITYSVLLFIPPSFMLRGI